MNTNNNCNKEDYSMDDLTDAIISEKNVVKNKIISDLDILLNNKQFTREDMVELQKSWGDMKANITDKMNQRERSVAAAASGRTEGGKEPPLKDTGVASKPAFSFGSQPPPLTTEKKKKDEDTTSESSSKKPMFSFENSGSTPSLPMPTANGGGTAAQPGGFSFNAGSMPAPPQPAPADKKDNTATSSNKPAFSFGAGGVSAAPSRTTRATATKSLFGGAASGTIVEKKNEPAASSMPGFSFGQAKPTELSALPSDGASSSKPNAQASTASSDNIPAIDLRVPIATKSNNSTRPTTKGNSKLESWGKRDTNDISDDELFKQPPNKDCPICLLCLPTLPSGRVYKSCCGKIICCGCEYSPVYDNLGNEINEKKCPFCRTLAPCSIEEFNEWLQKRVEVGDAEAIYKLGCYHHHGVRWPNYYRNGEFGFPQDYDKALELFIRAGELGHAAGYNDVGYAYENGNGVEIDKKKAKYYYELAAMGGHVNARYNLGVGEENAGNMKRALKHYMIALECGHENSLKVIQKLYTNGHATKDDYAKALRAYQAYLVEIKSAQRDAARANYRYY